MGPASSVILCEQDRGFNRALWVGNIEIGQCRSSTNPHSLTVGLETFIVAEPRFRERRSLSRNRISSRVKFYTVNSKKVNRVSIIPFIMPYDAFYLPLQALTPSVHKTHDHIKKLIQHYLHHCHYDTDHGNKSS